MPAKITLSVAKGKLAGKAFVFEDRTTCIIGRSEDCHPQLPSDEDHATISRHHCLLDINPPDVRIRDFGSLNGTYVNQNKIGQREKDQTPEEGAQKTFPEHDLNSGDLIELGDTVFHVEIDIPVVCVGCYAEIPHSELEAAKRGPGIYQCASCRDKAASAEAKPEPPAASGRCAQCGKDVAAEIGHRRHGDYICKECKANPAAVLSLLLSKAKAGESGLMAIRGYTIIRELGRGGMGAVYLARHDESGRQVALKVMLPEVAAEPRSKDMFLREIANTKCLQHPHVVQLLDSGYSNGTFFLVIEFCPGGSLDKELVARGGKMEISSAAPIIFQVLDGLDYAHSAHVGGIKLHGGQAGTAKGLVHRDLKPHNIFFGDANGSRVAKVADFGLAKAFDTAGLSGQTRTGQAAGTPFFMPRQQVINFKYAGPDVDVWAAAASLYCMLTGVFPRDFVAGRDVWQTVMSTDAIPIRKRDRSIPKPLAEVIDRALTDKPEIGYKTAVDLNQALQGVV